MAFAESMGDPPPIAMSTSHPDLAIKAVASLISPIGLRYVSCRWTAIQWSYLRMLSDLTESTAMCRAKSLLNVLDHWRLLVKRSAGDDEGFGGPELCNDIRELFARP
jgi:hypothetical protein